MMNRQDQHAGKFRPPCFGKTFWKVMPLWIELIWLAICPRLTGWSRRTFFRSTLDHKCRLRWSAWEVAGPRRCLRMA